MVRSTAGGLSPADAKQTNHQHRKDGARAGSIPLKWSSASCSKGYGNQYALACIAGDRSVDPEGSTLGTGAAE